MVNNKILVKNILYKFIYTINVLKYWNKKVPLSIIEVWVGQTCTLKCKDCLHLIPYIKPEIYSVEKLLSDIDTILNLCDVDYISVVGGEPFTNKEIYKLIEYINNNKQLKKAKIITNGTIMPELNAFEALSKENNKIEVHIDIYPEQDANHKAFSDMLDKYKIPYEMYRYDDRTVMWWKYLGENKMKKTGVRAASISHRYCSMREVFTISKGRFTSCPRGMTTDLVYDFENNKYECLKISELTNDRRGRAYIATCKENIYMDYCKFCTGVTRDNPQGVLPGVQIKQ